MSTTEIQLRPLDVSTEQLDLVKRTVAQGATNDELKLFLYDCERQGVHPLDKLIHFTKYPVHVTFKFRFFEAR